MARNVPIGFDTPVTLRTDELSCYLCCGGVGDAVTGRLDRGQPLLQFDKSVLMLARSESSIISREVAAGMVYGSTVRIICPATQTVAVVVKNEASMVGQQSQSNMRDGDGSANESRSSGNAFRIVMRPQEQALHNSTFRVIQKMNSRSSGDTVMSGDNIVLLLEGTDLYIGGSEGVGKANIAATIEPCTWSIRAFDRGYSVSSGFVFAARAVSLEYRLQHAFLSCGDSTGRPTDSSDRQSMWVSGSHFGNDDAAASGPSSAANHSASLEHSLNRGDSSHSPAYDGSGGGDDAPDVFLERQDPALERQAISSRLLCSSKSLWCFETADPTIGGPLRVGDPYRLRHMASGRYLSVTEDIIGVRATVTMIRATDSSVYDRTTFELDASAEDESGHMSSSHSFVRLRHVATGQWISCGIRLSNFNVLAVRAVARASARDRFSIRHPHTRVVYMVQFVTSNLAVLREYADYFAQLHRTPMSLDRILRDDNTRQLLDRTLTALSSIRAFCCNQRRVIACGADLTFEAPHASSFPFPFHQQLLQDMQTHLLLLECMIAPFRGLNAKIDPPLVDGVFPMTNSMASHKEFRSIAAITLDLLRLLSTGSQGNADAIAAHIPLLVYLDRFGWDCAHTIRTVLENTQTLAAEIQTQIVLDLFALNAVNRSDVYLKCASELPRASASVVQYLQQHPHEFSFISTGSRGQRLEVVNPSRRGAGTNGSTNDSFALPDNGPPAGNDVSSGVNSTSSNNAVAFDVFLAHGNVDDLKYFAAMLKLLYGLVDTNSPTATEYVASIFSRERLIILLQSSFREVGSSTVGGIGDTLRAMFLKLAVRLYIQKDVDDLAVPKSFVIARSLPALRMTDAFTDGSFVRHVKISALEVLKSSKVQVTEQIGKNRLIAVCVDIWTLLLRYNLAARSEVDELLPILLALLDGRTDAPSIATTGNTKWNRYELTDESSVVAASKVAMCQLLEAYIDSITHSSVTIVALEVGKLTAVEPLAEMACGALRQSLDVLRSDDTIEMLLDLSLYESKALTRAAVSALTRIGTAFHAFSKSITALRVLHPSHNAPYLSLLRLVTTLQQKCRFQKSISKEISKLVADLTALKNIRRHESSKNNFVLASHSVRRNRMLGESGKSDASTHDELATNEQEVAAAEEQLFDEAEDLDEDASAPQVFSDFLSLLRSWKLHTTVLSWHPTTAEDLSSFLDFFILFSSEEENASSMCHSWPIVFRIVQETPELRRKALSLLELLWASGGDACAVRPRDIREVARIFILDQYVEALRALSAVTSKGTIHPSLQQEIFSLLNGAGIFVEGWCVTHPQQVVLQLMTLLVQCAAGNSFVQSASQKILPARTAMLLIESSSRREIRFKVLLLKFLVEVHLCQLDETESSRDVDFVKQQWCTDDVWWRLVRDDFLVAVDELVTSARDGGSGGGVTLTSLNSAGVQQGMRAYVMEASVALRTYFTTRFELSHVTRADWLLKDVRIVATTISHLIAMVPSIKLSTSEVGTIVLLAQSVVDAISTWTDACVAKLQDSLKHLTGSSFFASSKEAMAHGGGSFTPARSRDAVNGATHQTDDDGDQVGGAAAGVSSPMRHLLDRITLRVASAADDDDAASITRVVLHIRPKQLQDMFCAERKIISKLMTFVASQDFSAEGNTFVLKILNECANGGSTEEEQYQLQALLGEEQAVLATTVLVDASDRSVVRAALDLGIAVLNGGNTKVQNEFLRYFVSVDERFFLSAKRILENAALEVRHFRRSQTSLQPFRLFQDGVAFSSCKKLLRVIQLLCEGHHFQLQEYCREQTDNLRSVSVPQMAVTFLSVFVDGTLDAFESIVLQCFNLLTELCQGPCSGNQNLLVSSDLVSLIDKVLRQEAVTATVKAAATTTLIALVEGCTDSHVAEMIMRQLNMNTIVALFDARREDEASMDLIFGLGIFLHCMQDLLVGNSLHFPISQVLHKRPDIAKQTGRIQIQRDDLLERVYFRIPAVCRRIREESKLRLLWDVDRSSQAAKHSSFYDVSESLIVELDLVSAFEAMVNDLGDRYSAGKYVRAYFTPSVAEWVIVAVAISALANFFMMLGIFSERSWWYFPLSVVELLVSMILLALDLGISAPVYIHRQMKKKLRQGSSSGLATTSSTAESGGGSNSKATNNSSGSSAESASEISLFANLQNRFQILQTVARPDFFFFALLFAASALSCCFGPKWLVLHLFGGISLSPALKNVIAAVTLNRRTLGLTVLLALLCCYSFTLVGYSLFPNDFDGHCRTLPQCFVHVVTVGFRHGGGIGEVMTPSEWESASFFPRRLFDFSFWVVMIIIFLNIIFGIIIDTFAELRDAKQAKESDMRHKCFVCGIDSYIFDRYGDGFASHTKYEHNMWQYLFFIQHLRLKDPNDYTGQESFVAHHLLRKDFSFFPTRSLALEEKTNITESASRVNQA